VWTGLVRSSLGAIFSMILLLLESAAAVLFPLGPQGGIPAIQAAPAVGRRSWSLPRRGEPDGLLLTLSAEVIALDARPVAAGSRTSRSAVDAPAPAEA